jgi:purine nucleosidase
MRLIIDSDAGVDDAHALMMALACPTAVVEAITAVTGNIHVDQVCLNILTVLDVMQQDVPVFRGAEQPLVAPWQWETASIHGNDGLGDWPDRPSSHRQIEVEHGVITLLRLTAQYPGELTLVALGPLTNIALAARLDPAFPSRVARLIVMGGAISGRGNTRVPAAEFNIYCDPEAAHIVFNAFPHLTLITWETTLSNPLPWEQVDTLLNLPGPRAHFFKMTSWKWIANQPETKARPPYLLPDPLAMAAALRPDLVEESRSCRVSIELGGALTRGQTVVDYRSDRLPDNVQAVTRLNMDGVFELHRQMLLMP